MRTINVGDTWTKKTGFLRSFMVIADAILPFLLPLLQQHGLAAVVEAESALVAAEQASAPAQAELA